MILMDPFILSLAAYTAIVVIVVFITVYSAMFDWYRHPMGRLMNFSLLSGIVIAFGGILRDYYESTGMLLSAVGWGIFSVLLLLRLRVLISSKAKTAKESREYPEEYPAEPPQEESAPHPIEHLSEPPNEDIPR